MSVVFTGCDGAGLASCLLFAGEMLLNAEALDIMAYLQTAPGKFVSLREISRRAGGRRRYEEAPTWASCLVPALVEAGFIQVNGRGHYRLAVCEGPEAPAAKPTVRPKRTASKAQVVGDDYFPPIDVSRIVGDDYFPTQD